MASFLQTRCFNCGAHLELPPDFGRREECPKCGADVHCCKNCRFYDPQAYNECSEPQAEVVREKERANFCDFFQLNQKAQGGQDSTKDQLREAAEALFKKD